MLCILAAATQAVAGRGVVSNTCPPPAGPGVGMQLSSGPAAAIHCRAGPGWGGPGWLGVISNQPSVPALPCSCRSSPLITQHTRRNRPTPGKLTPRLAGSVTPQDRHLLASLVFCAQFILPARIRTRLPTQARNFTTPQLSRGR